MKEKENEIHIRLTAKRYTPEHIAEIQKAAEASGFPMDEFVHMCISKYLQEFWLPRRIEVSTSLFRDLVKRAQAEDKTLEAYCEEQLRATL